MAADGKTFLLGAGAQKAGTTWLHSYLAAQPGTDLGAMKEYHVWDGIAVPGLGFYDRRGTAVARLRDRLRGRPPSLQAQMQRDPDRYFDYFAGLLARDGVRLTADITPAYAALPAAVIARIADGFAARGIAARAVFLVRDPVDRAWSAVRMYHRLGEAAIARAQGVDISRPPDAALLAYLDTDQARLRGDYPRTLAALRAVFPPDRLFIGCYETFFTPAELARLSAFLGLPADPARLEDRVFGAGVPAPLDPAVRAAARARLADIYAHFEQGADRWIGAAWAARAETGL